LETYVKIIQSIPGKEEYMELGENIVSALIGAATAAVTSLIGFWVSYRNLRAEYLAKRKIDLSSKQVAACEALWIILEPASRSQGEVRMVIYRDDQPYIVLSIAREFYTALCKVFYSTAGLYFSRTLRNEFFDLRDFIMEEFISKAKENQKEIQIAKNKAKSLDGKVQQLRIAIRAELGVEDLNVASENPIT
jgi:hypothetical protein